MPLPGRLLLSIGLPFGLFSGFWALVIPERTVGTAVLIGVCAGAVVAAVRLLAVRLICRLTEGRLATTIALVAAIVVLCLATSLAMLFLMTVWRPRATGGASPLLPTRSRRYLSPIAFTKTAIR